MESLLDSFDLFIFDLDGTLVDSHRQIEIALNKARKNLMLPLAPQDHVWNNLGKPVESLISDLSINNELLLELIDLFRKNLNVLIMEGNNIFPYAAELLKKLRSQHKKIALATGKSSKMADLVIKNSNLNGLIDFIQGTDNFAHKPDPTVIKLCLKRFEGLNAVMVGDRAVDIAAAKNADIASIGIAQSADSIQVLKSIEANHIFNNIEEFYTSLFNL